METAQFVITAQMKADHKTYAEGRASGVTAGVRLVVPAWAIVVLAAGVSLAHADLRWMEWGYGARLVGASLVGARLDGARLDGARLDGASLVGARLDGASLVGARLDGASLVGARLDGASLVGASLVGARLVGARLDGASLVGARLDGASLVGARLDGASLVGARLDGARLDGARLDGARLDGARLDDATTLPTRETWKRYREEVVPALLLAGGKRSIEWHAKTWDQCHSWSPEAVGDAPEELRFACPMAEAFGIRTTTDAPVLYWPRIEQFVQLYDAKLLPLEKLPTLQAALTASPAPESAAP